jgi:hypothetical protein
MADDQITESEAAFANILALLISSTCIAEPGRKAGFDAALAAIRDTFVNGGKGKPAALTELIRDRSNAFQNEEEPLNKLLRSSGASASRPN